MWYPTRKGETVAALHDRLAGCLTVLVPEVQRRFAGAHKRILLVSHAAAIIALVHELIGDRSLSLRVACCSLTVLDRNKDTTAAGSEGDSARGAVVGGWTAILLAGGEHLKDGLQRAWGFPDVPIADGKVSGRPSRLRISWECGFGLTLIRLAFLQIVYDRGEQGTENEEDEPVGSQVIELSSRM